MFPHSYFRHPVNRISADDDSGVDESPFGSKDEIQANGKSMTPTGTEFLFASKSGTIYGVDKERQRNVHKVDQEHLPVSLITCFSLTRKSCSSAIASSSQL